MILALRFCLPFSSSIRVLKSQPPSFSKPDNEGVAYLGFMSPCYVGDRIGEKKSPLALGGHSPRHRSFYSGAGAIAQL